MAAQSRSINPPRSKLWSLCLRRKYQERKPAWSPVHEGGGQSIAQGAKAGVQSCQRRNKDRYRNAATTTAEAACTAEAASTDTAASNETAAAPLLQSSIDTHCWEWPHVGSRFGVWQPTHVLGRFRVLGCACACARNPRRSMPFRSSVTCTYCQNGPVVNNGRLDPADQWLACRELHGTGLPAKADRVLSSITIQSSDYLSTVSPAQQISSLSSPSISKR